MAVLAPAVAAVRTAVSTALAGSQPGGTVLVACSGGADSLALAAAALFVARRRGLGCGLVTIDHGLQAGSASRAGELADWATGAGFDPVVVRAVDVRGRPGGPEAAARDARYAALIDVARQHPDAIVLLGHTRDDQAETVLLALARGGGPRGLAGMPPRRVRDGVVLARPLLEVSRAQTRAACAALELNPWDDPHNTDPAYARPRVRAALPVLVDALGPDLVDNLARTAKLLAADVELLDRLAAEALDKALDGDGRLEVAALDGLPTAIRTRVLHAWALRLGAAGADLSHRHVDALDALVTDWHGQGHTALPGGIFVGRGDGWLSRFSLGSSR